MWWDRIKCDEIGSNQELGYKVTIDDWVLDNNKVTQQTNGAVAEWVWSWGFRVEGLAVMSLLVALVAKNADGLLELSSKSVFKLHILEHLTQESGNFGTKNILMILASHLLGCRWNPFWINGSCLFIPVPEVNAHRKIMTGGWAKVFVGGFPPPPALIVLYLPATICIDKLQDVMSIAFCWPVIPWFCSCKMCNFTQEQQQPSSLIDGWFSVSDKVRFHQRTC